MEAYVDIDINKAFDSLSGSEQEEFTESCLDKLSQTSLSYIIDLFLDNGTTDAMINELENRGFKVTDEDAEEL